MPGAQPPGEQPDTISRWQAQAREIPPCTPEDLSISVTWTRDGRRLRGEIVATNTGGRVCRLGDKPGLTPLRGDGSSLGVSQWVSLELRLPPYVILQPGRQASAEASWSGWLGPPASGRVRLSWIGGSVVVRVRGPVQPGEPKHGRGSISTGWFELIEPETG